MAENKDIQVDLFGRAMEKKERRRTACEKLDHKDGLPLPVVQASRAKSDDAKGHTDGWANLLTGLGLAGSDKRLSSAYISDANLTWSDLTYLYRSDGLAKRVINLMTDDMFRAWFKVEGDTDGKVELELKKLEAKKQLKQAVRLGRLFGGAVAVLGVNDGRTYDQPVNESAIKGVEHIHVFDRYRLTTDADNVYLDPKNKKYGTPERYLVTPLYGAPFYVHETRILRFEGEAVTDIIRIQNQGWGDSVLQAVWQQLRALGESYANCEHIIDEFIIGVMTITNLQEMISQGKEEKARKRLNLVDMTKSVMNTILLDNEEKYERISSTTTGVSDIMDKIIESLSSVTGYPVCLLMGRSQAGLSNDEASQIRFYYDVVKAEQEEKLEPQLNRLIHYINIGLGSPLEDQWFLKFNSLWQPTDKEIIEQRKMQAETDQIYLTNSVLMPEEVAISRFGGETYSHDTALSEPHKIILGSGPGNTEAKEANAE
jgi:phage-related protein (TIGR01555 family)